MNAGVIVVGAGPVGLMLAGELRLGGADVVLYDKLPAPTGESRALGFNRRTAESFDQRGLLSRLGKFIWGPQSHFGGIRIDLSMLDESHNGVLGLPQARTEQMLAEWLSELGVPIRRGYTVTGFDETNDGVVVDFDGPDGRCQETAKYLVGCDGGESTIRSLTGVETPGWESTRGMYTAEITGIEMRQRPIGERLPGGNMVVCTSLRDGRYRIVIQDSSLPPDLDPDTMTFAEVAEAWQRVTGDSIATARPLWMWACGNAAKLAASYRIGRVFLAGDAAHAIPPMAAWGLSAGVQDAVNLGWKLAAAVNGWASQDLLDTYHSERHPIGEQLMRNAQAASMLYLTGEEMDPLRSVMNELVTYKDAAAHLAGMVSGLGIRYDMGPGTNPHLGKRIPPDTQITLTNGTTTRIADLLHPARGLYINTTGNGDGTNPTTSWADRIDTITGTWTTTPGPQQALIRPDGYIAWTTPDGGHLPTALTRWFGTAHATITTPR